MGAVWPSVCRNEMSGQRLEVRRGVFIPQVKIEPFRSTSEVPTQIPGLPTYEENTVHNRSEVRVCKSVSELLTNVGTSDGHHFRRTSGLPTVITSDDRRDFRRTQTVGKLVEPSMPGLPAWVGTSDCREFRHTSGLPTTTVTAQAVTGSQHFRQES